jgi:Domain of unknown function (DUF4214)
MTLSTKRIIVVLGMHRSGTSALTRGLTVLGAELGEKLISAVPGNNEKGFFEDLDVVELNNSILDALDSQWDCTTPISVGALEQLKGQGFLLKAVDLIRQKTSGKKLFALKDPRLPRLLAFWQEVFKVCQLAPRYVIAIRHPISVAQSLAARDDFNRTKSYLLWFAHVLGSLAATGGKPRIIVDFDRLIESPESQLRALGKAFDLRVNTAALREYSKSFLEQGLRHYTFSAEDLQTDNTCPAVIQEMYPALLASSIGGTRSASSTSLRDATTKWSKELVRLEPVLSLLDRQSLDLRDSHRRLSSINQRVSDTIKLVLRHDHAFFERVFDGGHYISQHPDLANLDIAPYTHFVHNGLQEGRKPSDNQEALLCSGISQRVPELLGMLSRQTADFEQRFSSRETELQAALTQAHEQLSALRAQLVEREQSLTAHVQSLEIANSQQQADFERRLTNQEGEHQSALTEATKRFDAERTALIEREQSLTAHIESLEATHQSAFKQLSTDFEQRLLSRENENGIALAEAQNQLIVLSTTSAEHEQSLTAQILSLEEAHVLAVNQLNADFGQRLADVESKHGVALSEAQNQLITLRTTSAEREQSLSAHIQSLEAAHQSALRQLDTDLKQTLTRHETELHATIASTTEQITVLRATLAERDQTSNAHIQSLEAAHQSALLQLEADYEQRLASQGDVHQIAFAEAQKKIGALRSSLAEREQSLTARIQLLEASHLAAQKQLHADFEQRLADKDGEYQKAHAESQAQLSVLRATLSEREQSFTDRIKMLQSAHARELQAISETALVHQKHLTEELSAAKSRHDDDLAYRRQNEEKYIGAIDALSAAREQSRQLEEANATLRAQAIANNQSHEERQKALLMQLDAEKKTSRHLEQALLAKEASARDEKYQHSTKSQSMQREHELKLAELKHEMDTLRVEIQGAHLSNRKLGYTCEALLNENNAIRENYRKLLIACENASRSLLARMFSPFLRNPDRRIEMRVLENSAAASRNAIRQNFLDISKDRNEQSDIQPFKLINDDMQDQIRIEQHATKLKAVDHYADLNDSAFIETIYAVLLKRQPDTAGSTHYLARLREGASRQNIIDALIESSEYKNRIRQEIGTSKV